MVNLKVDLKEVIAFSEQVHKTREQIVTDLDTVQKHMERIISTDEFTGKTANTTKDYFIEVHQVLIDAFQQLLIEIDENLTRHIEHFLAQVDTDEATIIDRNYLNTLLETIDKDYIAFQDEARQIANALSHVANYAPVTIPLLSPAEEMKHECQTTVENVEANLNAFTATKQSSHTEQLMFQIEQLINQLRMNVDGDQIDTIKSLSTYTENIFLESAILKQLGNGQTSNMIDKTYEKAVHLAKFMQEHGWKIALSTFTKNKDDKIANICTRAELDEMEDTSNSFMFKLKNGFVTVGRPFKGIGKGIYDFGEDTVVGIYNTVRHPIKTGKAVYHAATHPVETGRHIKHSIQESYDRDMKNGDAESRARWVTYAIGTIGTSIVGTKGVDKVSKVSKIPGKVPTKTAVKNISQYRLEDFLPYHPKHQLEPAFVGNVPYNVVDSNNLQNQLLTKFHKYDSFVHNDKIFNKQTIIHVFHGELNRRNKAVGYHHESMMGGKIIPGTKTKPDKNGVYRAEVMIQGKKKKAISTFFPEYWDRTDVLKAIREAYANKIVINERRDLYKGHTSEGIEVY